MAASVSVFRFLRLVFIEDWLLKIFCIVLAALSWIYIDAQLTDIREISMVLSFDRKELALPEGMELAEPDKKYVVQLQVRGPLRRLPVLQEKGISFDYQNLLPNPAHGTNRVRLVERFKVERERDMTVVAVAPEEIEIGIVQISRRKVPVRVRTTDDLPKGYQVTDSTYMQPAEVTITSNEDLQQVSFVWTDAVDVSNRRRGFRAEVGINPVISVGEGDQKRELDIVCDDKVIVWLDIRRNEITQTLENVPIQALTPPGTAIAVVPASTSVRVKGPEDEIARIIKNPAQLRLYVEWPTDWEAQSPPDEVYKSRAQQVKYIAPPGITVSDPKGQPLSVRIRGVRAGALAKP